MQSPTRYVLPWLPEDDFPMDEEMVVNMRRNQLLLAYHSTATYLERSGNFLEISFFPSHCKNY